MAENISKVLYPNDNVCVHANIRLSSFARKGIHREGITTHLNDACLYFLLKYYQHANRILLLTIG